MADKFTFSSAGLVHELEMAMDRAGGWNAALVKRLSEGDRLVHVREYLLNLAEITYSKTAVRFKVWRTIKLGTGLKTADDFRNALKREGMKVDDRADDLLGQKAFTASESEKVADLVVVSLAELGFKNRAKREDIYKRAQELGLDLCPAEVGPQLRLQYKDQPKGEWLLIAMEPITDSAGGLDVFGVARGGNDRWLSGGCGCPADFWYGGHRWVFARRK